MIDYLSKKIIFWFFFCIKRFGGFDQEKNIYESYLIVLDAVEQCLANVI
jgi:hypothetical protein